jgi:hypothetical protein
MSAASHLLIVPKWPFIEKRGLNVQDSPIFAGILAEKPRHRLRLSMNFSLFITREFSLSPMVEFSLAASTPMDDQHTNVCARAFVFFPGSIISAYATR